MPAQYRIERSGDTFSIPSRISLSTAARYLADKAAEEDRDVRLMETFNAHPADVAIALERVTSDVSGGAAAYWDTEISRVPCGPAPTDVIDVNYGRVTFPGRKGYLQVHSSAIVGECIGKDREFFTSVLAEVRNYLASHSIYRGRAIRLPPDSRSPITFRAVLGALPIYSESTAAAIDAGIMVLIGHPQDARRILGGRLRRGILLWGPYGSGKTLALGAIADHAAAHNITSIECSAAQLADTIPFAALYSPAIVLTEDVETIACDREEGAALLEALDNLGAKASDVSVVATTNHPERIHPAFLRPGRFDQVIEVGLPDAGARAALIEHFAEDSLVDPACAAEAAAYMDGFSAAAIREAVVTARLLSITDYQVDSRRDRITTSDLRRAAAAMSAYATTGGPVDARRAPRSLGAQVGDMIDSLRDALPTIARLTDAL